MKEFYDEFQNPESPPIEISNSQDINQEATVLVFSSSITNVDNLQSTSDMEL